MKLEIFIHNVLNDFFSLTRRKRNRKLGESCNIFKKSRTKLLKHNNNNNIIIE